MAYIKPELVQSPRNKVADLKIIADKGEKSWALAKMTWDGDPEVYGMRWNGRDENHGIGNPQSRGVPTWFILPTNVGSLIESSLELLD